MSVHWSIFDPSEINTILCELTLRDEDELPIVEIDLEDPSRFVGLSLSTSVVKSFENSDSLTPSIPNNASLTSMFEYSLDTAIQKEATSLENEDQTSVTGSNPVTTFRISWN